MDSSKTQADIDPSCLCLPVENEDGQPLYTPLDAHTDEIRILQLSPGSWDDPIVCATCCAQIKKQPVYTALSYAWGDPADTRKVYLNNHPVEITRNLFAALRRLRDTDRVKHLWADTLCINQADDDERGHQVSLMGQIYSNSTNAIMWLGEYLEVDSEAYTVAKWGNRSGVERSLIPEVNVKEAFEDIGRLANNEHIVPWAPTLDTPYGNISMWMLLELPWWDRVWTFQEYVLPRSVTLACGSSTIDFDTLDKAMYNWSDHHRWKGCCIPDTKHSNLRTHGLTLLLARSMHVGLVRGWREIDDNYDILWTHSILSDRKASNHLDRIFGMFGIFPEVAADFAVDYSMPASQLCTDFFFYLVTSTRNLRAWTGLARFPRDASWATWVPNWCYDYEGDTSITKFCSDIFTDYDESNATRNEQLDLGRPFPDVLSLVGIQLGQVAQVRGFEPNTNDKELAFEDLSRTMSIGTSQSYPTGQTYGEVIAKLRGRIKIGARHVFFTDRGYVGYGFNNATVGDTIHIMFGSNLPVILRASQSRDKEPLLCHEIDGPVYIAGIMNGEALDWGLVPETYFLV